MTQRKKIYFFITLFLISTACILPAQAVSSDDLRQQLKSESAILIDGDTGQVLFEKEMHKQMRPASITKIMTALLALEDGDLNDTITMSYDAVFSVGRDTSHIALDVGEELTLEQALYALALASANDAANGIAEHIGGTLDSFVALMNERAKKIGALNTNFANAHGLPDSNHYTSAFDMARITMAAIKMPEFPEVFSATKYDMLPTNKQPEQRTFWCKNAMMVGKYKYNGVIAEKTGWTNDSQHTLVTVAERNRQTLIAVVLKSPAPNDKWEDATALLDYGFNEFESMSFTAEELSADGYIISDNMGTTVNVNLSTSDGFSCLIPKSLTKSDVDIKYIPETDFINSEPQIKAVFSLKPAYVNLGFVELGELKMSVFLNENADEAVPVIGDTEDVTNDSTLDQTENKTGWPPFLVWFLSVVGVLLGLFVILYTRRWIIIQRRRRRRYQQKR